MKPQHIVHVMRAPVGGLFRHVVDLSTEQVKAGHAVGIVADARTGGERADAVLATLAPTLALGILRVPMSRQIGLSDLSAHRTIKQYLASVKAGIVHGHGAKGGAFARLAAPRGALRVYTPHGGSLHYSRKTPVGFIYLTLEARLAGKTDLFLFESRYSLKRYGEVVCDPGAKARVVHNGVSPAEFAPVSPLPDATDIVFVGELRTLKGVDVLIKAIGLLHGQGRVITATIVGAGPDEAAFKAQAQMLGPTIRFTGALPARQGFAMGKVLVVPSRAESLPYIILEGAAAGLPVIATEVGGIAEIYGEKSGLLIKPDDASALAKAIGTALDEPQTYQLRDEVAGGFSLKTMADGVSAAYASSL